MREPLGTWGLRLLALALAILTWVYVTVGKQEPVSVKAIDTTIRYDSPDGFILLDPPEDVRVTVRGKASELRNLNPFQVDVSVEVTPAKGTYEVQLNSQNVFLPGDLEIVSIEPSVISLALDREVTRMLPVHPRLTGEPAAGAVALSATVTPARVPVRGPESRINQIASLTTTPISLDGHALDFEERAGVVSEDRTVQVLQAVVTVRIPMQIPSAGDAPGR
jgi:YbbR domain-containing protein